MGGGGGLVWVEGGGLEGITKEVGVWLVKVEAWRERGRTILTVPSQELDTKVSFAVWFQKTEKVSLLCSW